MNNLPGGFREEVRHLERFGDVGSHRALDPHGPSGMPLCEARQIVELVVYAPKAGVNAVPLALVRHPSLGGVDEVLPPSHDVGLGACVRYEKVIVEPIVDFDYSVEYLILSVSNCRIFYQNRIVYRISVNVMRGILST